MMPATAGEARTFELISAVATAHRGRAVAQAAVKNSTSSGALTVHQVEAADRAREAFEAAVLELLKAAGEVTP